MCSLLNLSPSLRLRLSTANNRSHSARIITTSTTNILVPYHCRCERRICRLRRVHRRLPARSLQLRHPRQHGLVFFTQLHSRTLTSANESHCPKNTPQASKAYPSLVVATHLILSCSYSLRCALRGQRSSSRAEPPMQR